MRNRIQTNLTLFLIILLITTGVAPIINAQIIQKQPDEINPIYKRNEDNYDLLIITPKQFEKTLQPLINHKNRHNIRTKLVTLDEVYKEMFWHGRDKPEKIKYFIKNAVEEWSIKYVLLIGYFRLLPIRYVYNDENYEHFPEPFFISELYYADIYDKNGSFSNWDTNNNGIFGEWKGETAQDKDIDLYPDVYVGRLACRNKLELKTMIDKIIKYETQTYGADWFNRIVVVAGDTYPEGQYDFPTPEYEGEENAKTVLSFMPGFENTTLFTSDGTLTGSKDVIREINKGCGFLFFDGHANPRSWSTHPPNQTTWVDGLSTRTMTRLFNGYKLPVCVVGGCHNLQFDVNLLNLLKEPFKSFMYSTGIYECWGWKLTRKIGGGSIATIGCSGLGMTKEDKESYEGASDYLDSQFFYEYGINGTSILGECWGKAISNYLDRFPIDWDTPSSWDYAYDAKTVQQWILMGDPSLKIGGYPNS